MFVVEVGAAMTTVVLIRDLARARMPSGFTFQITLWLWFTVLFANFAEAMAEARGKAQADTLRKTKTETHGQDAFWRTDEYETFRLRSFVPATLWL